MNIEIPKANTHRDVAKEQHLVPRTYMRKWSYNNSDSIYVFDKNKREKGVQPANVNSINYIGLFMGNSGCKTPTTPVFMLIMRF